MKKADIISGILLFSGSALLLAMAPDRLSMMIVGVMFLFIATGYLVTILPCSHFSSGFRNARTFIQKTRRVQSENMWVTVARSDALFRNDLLDSMFGDYKEKIKRRARESSRSLYDVSDVINEDVLEMKTWLRVTGQIPNILTALGILGTFLGLISGISNIQFSSVEVAVDSVQMLLSGISTAFYTSVAGVILSIIYTIVSRMMWGIMVVNMDNFFHDFHMYVSDTADVRDKLLRNANVRDILQRLDQVISLQRSEEAEHE